MCHQCSPAKDRRTSVHGQSRQLSDPLETACSNVIDKRHSTVGNTWRLRGKRAAVLLFSYYPSDTRPRLAAEALAKESVSVDLICLQENQVEPRREIINGVNVFRVPLKRCRGGK